MAGLAFPKPTKGTASLERRERRGRQDHIDASENRTVRQRSHGRCEMTELLITMRAKGDAPRQVVLIRCARKASQIHHLLGGRGTRGVGRSALAIHKQHVCTQCHDDITGDVGGKALQRIGGAVPRWSDYYRRVR